MLFDHAAVPAHSSGSTAPTDSPAWTSSARIQNYLLGGRDYYERDRETAERMNAKAPFLTDAFHYERQYVLAMIQALAIAGVRQLLDFGCGLPHRPSPVEVITRVQPDARVVCIDRDRTVHAHGRALLQAPAPAVLEHLEADVCDAQTVLASPEVLKTINWHEPVILLFGSVLHHIRDTPAHPVAVLINQYKEIAAPGSALVITHATADFAGKPIRKAAKFMAKAGCPLYLRSRDEVIPLFDGWALSAPGLAAPQEMTLEHPVGEEAASYVGMAWKESGR